MLRPRRGVGTRLFSSPDASPISSRAASPISSPDSVVPPAPPLSASRTQSRVATRLFPSPPVSPDSVAPPISSSPGFAVEDYLVATCGLTRAQAHIASTKIPDLYSPTGPDAVIAYLADLGLSCSEIATLVAKDPKFLCISAERTLNPILVGLTALGLSRPEIARIVPFARGTFRSRSVVSRVRYYLDIFGSFEHFLLPLRRSSRLLASDPDKTAKPNVAFLHECGLGAPDKLCTILPGILTSNLERVQAMVACAEGLGVPRGSGMFRLAIHAVGFLSEEKMAAKKDHLKDTLGWSDAEVGTALCKAPTLLTCCKEKVERVTEFLIFVVGLEPAYIAHRPAMLAYSLEDRLRPRYYVVKFLKEKGLLRHDRDYYAAVNTTNEVFIQKFIMPHVDVAEQLAQDYAAACRGELPLFAVTSARMEL